MNTAPFLRRAISATLVVGAILSSNTTAWADPKITAVQVTQTSPSPTPAGSNAVYQLVITHGTGATITGDLLQTNSLPPGVVVSFVPPSLTLPNGVNLITGSMVVAVSPGVGTTNIALCVRCENASQPSDFAISCAASLSSVSTSPPSCSVSGPSTTCPNTSGLTYTDTTDALTPQFSWIVTGNGSIAGPATNASVTVNAAAAGSFTAACTVTDVASGKSNTCSQVVSVSDTTAPSISSCPTGVTVNTDAGTNVATNVNLGAAPTASDLCGIGNITSNAPAAFPVGTNVVTWTVADNNGNSTNCQQDVIVMDNEPPQLTCPANIFTNLAVGECSITNLDIGVPVVSDNVGIASVTSNAPAVFNAGTNQVVWTATDTSGNASVCTQIVALLDITAPQISLLPAAQQDSAGAGCQAAVPNYASSVVASDDCTGSNSLTVTQSPTAGTLVGTGTNVVTITVADDAGNSTQSNVNFIVVDDTPPQITTCATNQQASANGGGTATVPDFTSGVIATDNCGSNSLTVTQSPTAGTTVGIGATNITLTVTDGSGNSNTCIATFTVDDTTPPQITQCAGDQSAEAGAGCQATVPDFTAGVSASDNSGVAPTVTQSPLAGTLASFGTNAVTLTPTDGSGNFTNCTAQFIVADTTLPSITQCATDIVVNTDAGTNFASNVNLGAAPIASDVCGLAGTTNNAPVTFPFGTNIVTWTVTDTHGNQATCQQQVVVSDNQPPLIACPANISTNLATGECSVTNLDLGTPVTSDNVGVASVSSNAPASYGVGTNEVVWTAADLEGNTAVCTQLVVVLDTTAPTINSLPSDQQASVGAGCQAPVPDFTAGVSASDDCSGTNSLTITQSPTAGTLVGSGTNTITIIVADASDNTTTGTVDFTVADTTPPTITQCPPDQQASSGTNGTVAVPDFTSSLTATGNCSGSLTVTQSPTAGTLVGMGSHTITLTVTDDAGNSNTCTATFSVDDTTPPQITQCAGNQSASAGAGCQAAVPNFTGGVVATDDSGLPPTITQSPLAGTLVGLGTNTVTLTATDGSGNFTNCTAQFIVADTTVPLIACPGDVVVTAPVGSNSVTGVSLGSPTASDNCGTVTVTNDAPASFPIGNTIVTWTADDGNGNTSTCQQTVTVAGSNTAPVANNDSYTVGEDDVLDVAAPGVLGNDTDADLNSLTAILVSTTTNGVLTLNTDGAFSYVPSDNFSGADSFTYRASDGSLTSGVATVSITVSAVNGAGDIDLYAKSESFKINWATTGHDQFKIKGKINPRGANEDLAGATMQISVNGTNIFAPVTLDSVGNGAATVGSTKVKAKLNSATGVYSYTISGLDLRNIIGLPNTTGTGLNSLDVKLIIAFADLQVTPIRGTLENSFKTTAGKTSTGKFAFKKNRTLTGAFNWNKTTAAQASDGSFKVTGKGVAENEGGSGIAPTSNIRVTIGGSVFTIPAANVKFALNGTSRTFKISASGLTTTGIPLASANAPTVHELGIMFEVPVTGGTNIFETIIELKRPTGTSTKWKR